MRRPDARASISWRAPLPPVESESLASPPLHPRLRMRYSLLRAHASGNSHSSSRYPSEGVLRVHVSAPHLPVIGAASRSTRTAPPAAAADLGNRGRSRGTAGTTTPERARTLHVRG